MIRYARISKAEFSLPHDVDVEITKGMKLGKKPLCQKKINRADRIP